MAKILRTSVPLGKLVEHPCVDGRGRPAKGKAPSGNICRKCRTYLSFQRDANPTAKRRS